MCCIFGTPWLSEDEILAPFGTRKVLKKENNEKNREVV